MLFLHFFSELKTTGEDRDYTFEVKEPEFATLDSKTNIATAVSHGETTVSPIINFVTI